MILKISKSVIYRFCYIVHLHYPVNASLDYFQINTMYCLPLDKGTNLFLSSQRQLRICLTSFVKLHLLIYNLRLSLAAEDQNNLSECRHAARLCGELTGWNGTVCPPFYIKPVPHEDNCILNGAQHVVIILFNKQKVLSELLFLLLTHHMK